LNGIEQQLNAPEISLKPERVELAEGEAKGTPAHQGRAKSAEGRGTERLEISSKSKKPRSKSVGKPTSSSQPKELSRVSSGDGERIEEVRGRSRGIEDVPRSTKPEKRSRSSSSDEQPISKKLRVDRSPSEEARSRRSLSKERKSSVGPISSKGKPFLSPQITKEEYARHLEKHQEERLEEEDVRPVKEMSKEMADTIMRGHRKQEAKVLFGKKEPSYESMVAVIKNRLDALIREARGDTKFVKTLGQWRGSDSRENQALGRMLRMTFTSGVNHEGVVKEGLFLIRKGYGDHMPKEVNQSIGELKDCLRLLKHKALEDHATEQAEKLHLATARFNKRHPPTGRKEGAVDDLSSPKRSLVQEEVSKAGSTPIKKEDVQKDKEYIKLINKEKRIIQKTIKGFLNKASNENDLMKNISEEDHSDFDKLFKADASKMSRYDLKQYIKNVKSIFKNAGIEKNFDFESLKKSMRDLKNVELESARHRQKTDLPIGQAEKEMVRRRQEKDLERKEKDLERKEKNLERFDKMERLDPAETPYEYEDISWRAGSKFSTGNKKENLSTRSKDDSAVEGMGIDDVTDHSILMRRPIFSLHDISISIRQMFKGVLGGESFISSLVWGNKPYVHERLRALSRMSIDEMNENELVAHIREAVDLAKKSYPSGNIPAHIQQSVKKLEVYAGRIESKEDI
jgi:hypothetical protein